MKLGERLTEQEIKTENTTMAKNWYILHTYSGFEKKVAETLKSRIDAEGLTEQFGEIMVPTEDVIEMRAGEEGGDSQALLSRLRAGGDGDER